MTDATPNLRLPMIAAAQAQKHVTHNEALAMLDSLAQIGVSARLAAPPGSPSVGGRWLVAAPATGAFAGREGAVAAFEAGGWRYLEPVAGWLCHVAAEARILLYDGSNWVDAPVRAADLFGVNASADAVNRLAVSSASVSFSHAGSDMRAKLNKATSAATGSLLFQTNWSGRAETGLCGDERYRVKVSADGVSWRTALEVDPATGVVAMPFTAGLGGGIATLDAGARLPIAQAPAAIGAYCATSGMRNRLRNAAFAINQRAVSGTVALAAGAYGHDGLRAGAAGAAYTFAASGVDTTITVTAGSLIMPVEPSFVEGGAFTLAHDGTAAARVWQGAGYSGAGVYASASRAAGGLQIANLNAAAQTNVEFSTGTILRPQLEAGAIATPFERRSPPAELALCQRYYATSYPVGTPPGTANAYTGAIVTWLTLASNYATTNVLGLPVTMRVQPTFTIYSPETGLAGKGRLQNAAADVPVFLSAWTTNCMTVGVANTPTPANDYFRVQYVASAEL